MASSVLCFIGFLCHSGVFLWSAGLRGRLEVKYKIEDASSCIFFPSFTSRNEASLFGERSYLEFISPNIRKNANWARFGHWMNRLNGDCTLFWNESFLERRKEQFVPLRFRSNDTKHVGDVTAAFSAPFQVIYSATVYPCWAAVASVLVFGSLFFILIWFFSYVCPQMLTSSKSHRLTATSYRNRQYRIDGISPFEGSLFLVFAVAVFFVGSTEAVESSCEECDPGWICYLSSCLKVSLLPSTWRQAAKTCSEQGSHLFSIQENYNCLWEFLYLECGKEQFFIGLLSTPAGRSDYSYRWSDGSPFAYSDWEHLDAHCPTELCKTITPYASVISWTSVDCSSSYRFICEKPKKPLQAALRLVDGVAPNRGYLESFLNVTWRRVCIADGSFEISRIAERVCQRLGYPNSLSVRALNRSGAGKKEKFSYYVDRTWDGVTSFSQKTATCHSELFVSCQSGRTHFVEARLLPTKVPNEGPLQFGSEGVWQTTCPHHFEGFPNQCANASCRYLGYDRGTSEKKMRKRPAALGAFCSTNSFDQCFFHFHFYCFHFLSVTCFYSEGQVRLVDTYDGLEETEGSVEVYFTGRWIVVCDEEWDIREVSVVCRQLGFKNAITAHPQRSKLTLSSKSHLALKVLCNGSETTVRECSCMRIPSQSCTLAKAVCKKKEYCPLGWSLYADYCYTVSRSHSTMRKTSLEEGRCGMFNSASINSPREQAFALRLLSKLMEDDVWISIRREDNDAFKWINGEPLRC
ncbi:uncharacterized protein [Oscarella lobularis]|uniref:uncharacterized protein isoform X2 n=1 Tax=Oscarella lobularis TaxID=121494 RepID=UPI003313D2FC